MPIGTWELKWDSASLVTRIFEILASEKLGFHVENLGGHSSSTPVAYMLGGCSTWNPKPENVRRECVHARRFHFAFESWQAAAAFLPPLLAELGDRAPVNLGSVGYVGASGMYILGSAVDAALKDSGLSLRYYSNYNADWFQPNKYTARVSDVDLSRLGPCTGVSETYDFVAGEHFEATGDSEGVYVEDGIVKYKCWKDKWWVSPACRNMPENCSTLITRWPGFGFGLLTQWTLFHNMPVAIAASAQQIEDQPDEYVLLGRELASLVYWWKPDPSFLSEDASEVILPPYDPEAHSQKIYSSAREKLRLTSWAAAGMDVAAYRAFALADALSMSDQEVDALLIKHLEKESADGLSADHWETACTWLKEQNIWKPWIPSDTACVRGKGLVDALGNYVTQVDAAVGCEVCPVGTSSQEAAETRICVACPEGTHQSLPGETSCEECEAGTIAPQEGMMDCAACSLGTFADAKGMKSCLQCGANVTLDTARLALFTTSQLVSARQQVWIPVQGAASADLCGCISGAYLAPTGLCELCPQGSICEGSKLLLQQGYYSPELNPGFVFQCKEQRHCPGGEPGSCATGRDPSSLACDACLPGLHDVGANCVPCGGGDYFFLTFLFFLVMVLLTIAYLIVNKYEEQRGTSQSFLLIASGLGQLVISFQVISVIHQFQLDWAEPISSIMSATEALAFELNVMSLDCITPSEPVMLLFCHSMVLPFLLVLLCCIHFSVLLLKHQRTWKLHRLGHMLGVLFVTFFISLCSTLLPPLICHTHPNQVTTVRAFPSVYCNGTGQHATMILVSSLAFLLPALFVAAALWVVLQLPSKVQTGDMNFIRATSFLYSRLRPGAESFSLWLLLRNLLMVLLPLTSSKSASTFMMNILLCASLVASAFVRPWRMMICNYLDMFLVASLIFVVTLGSHVAGEVNVNLTIVACLALFILMFLTSAAFVAYGASQLCVQRVKNYRFFLSHHKNKAGCVARWLKMELAIRGRIFTAFVDSDDLSDLTKLFWYVAHETTTCVFLASSDFLHRKWCVGEVATARMHKVHSVVVAWQDYVMPTQAFIENYGQLVPDIVQLARHNISLSDVQESLLWFRTLQTLPLSKPLTAESFSHVVSKLTSTLPRLKHFSREIPPCCIIADPENTEAVASAFVLGTLMGVEFVRQVSLSQPLVLTKGELVPSTTTLAVLVCTAGCFKSLDVTRWIAQLSEAQVCKALPILADDNFQLPGQDLYQELPSDPDLKHLLRIVVKTIKAIFEEIGIVCLPHMSSQEELELRARRIVSRLTDTPSLALRLKLGNADVPYLASFQEPPPSGSPTSMDETNDYELEITAPTTSHVF